MVRKKSLEALGRSLQDLRGNVRPFGNAVILLAGDFRQMLPVILQSTPADEINACLKYSTFLFHVKTLNLTQNMHVQLQTVRSAQKLLHHLWEIGYEKVPADQS